MLTTERDEEETPCALTLLSLHTQMDKEGKKKRKRNSDNVEGRREISMQIQRKNNYVYVQPSGELTSSSSSGKPRSKGCDGVSASFSSTA